LNFVADAPQTTSDHFRAATHFISAAKHDIALVTRMSGGAMASIVDTGADRGKQLRPGKSIASAIDRWIYVYMAASFVLVTLIGFIPDSIELVGDAKAGATPPLPLVLHFHAVLMGSFLLLLLAQTLLAATGKLKMHRQLGQVAFVLVPALVLVGFILVPTIYRSVWDPAHFGPPAARAHLQHVVLRLDNIMLLQLRTGILFTVFIFLGLRARRGDGAFHKRMIILAAGTPVPAAIVRMGWLPTTLPVTPLSTDLYLLALLSPMFIWDLVRTRTINRAYVLWLGGYLAVSIFVYSAWSAAWWQALAPRLMGV